MKRAKPEKFTKADYLFLANKYDDLAEQMFHDAGDDRLLVAACDAILRAYSRTRQVAIEMRAVAESRRK